VYFKDDLAVGSHRNSVSVGKCQRLVVVKNGVEIFNPNGIDWTVKHNPDVITLSS
jgi:hypothetical protein